MFLRPFLQYFAPFKGRLAVAFAAMFVVSVLSAVNVIMLKPFLEILLERPQPAAAAATAEVGVAGAATAATSPAGEPGAGKSSRGKTRVPGAADMAPEAARRWFEGEFGGPIKAIGERVGRVKDWYRTEARARPMRVLGVLSLLLLTLTAIKCLSEFLAEYQLAYSFYLATMRMKEAVYGNVLAQDYLFFTRNQPGYLISRINSDVKAIQDIVEKLVTSGFQEPLTLVFMACALVWISPMLTVVVAFLLPPIALILYRISRVLRKNTKKQKKKADELSGSMAESLYNIRLVKAFGAEPLEMTKFITRNMALFRYVMNRRIAKFGGGPIMEFIGSVAACGVLMLGGYLILGRGPKWAGTITADEFIVYLFTLTRFYRPMKGMSNMVIKYQLGRVSADRIVQMLELRPMIMESANPVPFAGVREGIELRDVTVRFDQKDILRGVNLRIPAGKRVALVGETGSGKTTIANLVARLFDPTEGRVLIDGVDLREYGLNDLRRSMGIVSQTTLLFDDTIAGNIAYGKHAVEGVAPEQMEGIVEAAKAAHAHEFIMNLDGGGGYKTLIGPSGARISGGQAQRLALARAIYRDPGILILDEATSALDSRTQALVKDAIDRLLSARTSLVIAHRLSTIQTADFIYVLEAGAVVEEGTHDQLMAMRGHYFRFHESDGNRSESAPEPLGDGDDAGDTGADAGAAAGFVGWGGVPA